MAVPTLGAPRPQGYYSTQRIYGGQVYQRVATPYQTVHSAAPQPLRYYNYPYVPAVAPVQKAEPESVKTPFGKSFVL